MVLQFSSGIQGIRMTVFANIADDYITNLPRDNMKNDEQNLP